MSSLKKCGNPKCKYEKCWVKAETCEKCGYSFVLHRLPRKSKKINTEEDFVKTPPKVEPPKQLNKECPKCHSMSFYRAPTCVECGFDFELGRHPSDIIEEKKKEKNKVVYDLRNWFPDDYTFVLTPKVFRTNLLTRMILVPSLYAYAGRKKEYPIIRPPSWRSCGLPLPRMIDKNKCSTDEDDVLEWTEAMMAYGLEGRPPDFFTTGAMICWSKYVWKEPKERKIVCDILRKNSMPFQKS